MNQNIDTAQAIILAAGKGTRMGAQQPKVLFEVAERPMVSWVIDACRAAGIGRVIVVVGFQGDRVREALADYDNCVFVEQARQKGTGHAAQMAEPLFDPARPTDVFVLAGDAPLLRPRMLLEMLQAHRQTNADTTMATTEIDDPTGYGRIVRDSDGAFRAIVEHKDADPDQRRIREINPSYYCFRSDALFATLHQVDNDNQQEEYYLTDVPTLQKANGRTVTVIDAAGPEDVLGVNTHEQLAQVDAILRRRLKSDR